MAIHVNEVLVGSLRSMPGKRSWKMSPMYNPPSRQTCRPVSGCAREAIA
jgi:hypothetical protein